MIGKGHEINACLSHDDFLTYFSAPMKEITATANASLDIWPYVDAAAPDYPDLVFGDVSYVYVDATERFHHVTINSNISNVFLVLIVDLSKPEIVGHRLLDLREAYGLSPFGPN